MTQRFILDENIVILAQRGENDSGETDVTCLQLVTQIIRICHTIVFDTILWNKYLHQLNLPKNVQAHTGPLFLRVLNQANQRDGKLDSRPTAAPFPEEDTIPQGSQDDKEIVRLAVETRATLVTTDAPLRDDLNSCGIQEQYGLDILSPEEALKSL